MSADAVLRPRVWAAVRRLLGHLRPRRRWQLAGLMGLMGAASVAEVISVGAVVPFLAVLTAPERLEQHAFSREILRQLEIADASRALLPLTAIFVVAALAAGAMRILLSWANTRYSFALGTELSCDIYRRTLYQPLAVHLARNSSEVITGIVTKVTMVVMNTLLPVLTLASSAVIFAAVVCMLAVVDIWVSIGSLVGFGSIYLVIAVFTRARKLRNGKRIASESGRVMKLLQEGFGGIRDVLLDGSQPEYTRTYAAADGPLRRAQGSNQYLAQWPRFAVEALGMTVIAVLAYLLAARPGGLSGAIPVLGALAVGAQRLLPLMQQAYAAWSSILGGQAALADTLALLEQPVPPHAAGALPEPFAFEKEVRLESVSFRYAPDGPWVLRDVSLTVPKGSRLGVIGATGSGKSTLLDVLMGLLPPTEGRILVDGVPLTERNVRGWQRHLAHVPQTVFLADDTVERNIAFGVPERNVDPDQVRRAADRAQLGGLIESWPAGYRTPVGERGTRLSGGQRQRIGIARALYKKADVIVLDEATSALDNETEQAVIESLERLQSDITVFMIAHRLTTLRSCTQVIEIAGGRVRRTGTYDEMIARPLMGVA